MSNVSDPAKFAAAVTPSDSTNLTAPTRGIYVGVGGNISVIIGGATVLFENVPVGILPIQVTRIRATGSTATKLVALW